MIRSLLRMTVPAVAILITAYLLPGVNVRSFGYAVLVALLLGVLNLFVKPILEILTIPITLLTMGLFLIILDALMVLAAAELLGGFWVDNLLWAILFSFIVSITSSLIYKLLD